MPGTGKLQSLCFYCSNFICFWDRLIFMVIILFSVFLFGRSRTAGKRAHFYHQVRLTTFKQSLESTPHMLPPQPAHPIVIMSPCKNRALFHRMPSGCKSARSPRADCSNNTVAGTALLQLRFLSKDAFSYYIVRRPSALAYQSNQS